MIHGRDIVFVVVLNENGKEVIYECSYSLLARMISEKAG